MAVAAAARYPNDAEPSAEFPIYSRGNVGEAFPNVISPMSGSLMLDASTRSQTRFFLAAGALSKAQVRDPRNAAFVQFGGYLYANVSMARIAAVRAPGLSMDDFDAQYGGVGVLPPYAPRRGDRSVVASVRLARFAARGLRRRDAERARLARGEVDTWIGSLAPVAAATEAELLDRTRRASAWFDRLLSEMMTVTLHAGTARIMVERLAAKAGDPDAANTITSGVGDVASAGPAIALWDLGRQVRSSPPLRAHFDEPPDELDDRLRADPACHGFVEGFDSFLGAFGFHGADELELSSPKWGTDPVLALRIVERLRHAPEGKDPRATARVLGGHRAAAVDRIAAQLRAPLRPLFRLAVRNAAIYAQAREATKAALVRALFESRRALDELAVRHGIDQDDIYLLVADELEPALQDLGPFLPTIEARRERRTHLQDRVPPFWFEGVLPDPSSWPLRSQPLATTAAAGGTLEGLGVSDGIVSGRARVIVDPNDPSDLEADEILVARETDPAWTPLFLAAAGVIVEYGAVMSHAAIVARELGIPAVVGVDQATNRIPTGTRVTIDGTTGRVTVHDDEGSSPR
jgi:phosphohistidine swiveling domain-containing protein